MNALNKVTIMQARPAGQHDAQLYRKMMAYDHPALKERMVVKEGWDPAFTAEVFEETKKFLYLCATNTIALAPPEDIDEMWHSFILFTADYAHYCRTTAGAFLHHQPLTQAQRARSDGSMIRQTLDAAGAAFGELSRHWDFSRIPGSCGPGVCGASTNCQS